MEDEALHTLYLSAFICVVTKEKLNHLLPAATTREKAREALAVIAVATWDAVRAERPRSAGSLRAELGHVLKSSKEKPVPEV